MYCYSEHSTVLLWARGCVCIPTLRYRDTERLRYTGCGRPQLILILLCHLKCVGLCVMCDALSYLVPRHHAHQAPDLHLQGSGARESGGAPGGSNENFYVWFLSLHALHSNATCQLGTPIILTYVPCNLEAMTETYQNYFF